MPASAESLADLLESRGMLPEFEIAELRAQLASAPDPVTAKTLAKTLFSKGKLTQFQARKLLADLEAAPGEDPEQKAAGESPSPRELSASSTGSQSTKSKWKDGPKKGSQPAPVAPSSVNPLGDFEDLQSINDLGDDDAGGTDDLLNEAISAESEQADPLALPAKKKGWLGGRTRGKRSRIAWDSPLIIAGAAGLVILLLLAVVFGFLFTRGSGDDVFQAAEQDYLDGAYANAIIKYEHFLDRHSGHPKSSLARVRIGTAELRQSVARQNWLAALETANEMLPRIENEQEFSQARPELASLLPDIAEGFSAAAQDADDLTVKQEQVELYRKVMLLIDKAEYLPGSQRVSIEPRLARIDEVVSDVVRDLNRDERLAETIGAINEAAETVDFQAAYKARRELLREYPRLEPNQALTAAISEVAQRLATRLATENDTIPPDKNERESPIAAEVFLANPSDASNPQLAEAASGHVVLVNHQGDVFALKADDGHLLWARNTGPADAIRFEPQKLSTGPTNDVMLVDTHKWDLLRVNSQSGELIWRIPVGLPFSKPLVEGSKAYVATSARKMMVIDLISGAVTGQARFPQELAGSPAVSRDGAHLIQLAEHSNLYLLEPDSLTCRHVLYLGHEPGMVRESPRILAGMALIPLLESLDRSQLQIVRIDDESPKAVQRLTGLPGQLAAPLVIDRGRVLLAFESGALQYYDVDTANAAEPLKLLAENSGGELGQNMWPLVNAGKLLVAGKRLSSFLLPATRGNLTRRWATLEGRRFRGPLHHVDPLAVATYSSKENPVAVTVGAFALEGADQPDQPIWETIIAAGAAGDVSFDADNRRVMAMTTAGELYAIDASAMKAGVVNKPIAAAKKLARFNGAVQLKEDARVFGTVPPSETSLYVASSKQKASIIDVKHKVPAGKVTSLPIQWRDGLLVPSSIGQVFLIDPTSGEQTIHPFQPTLQLGKEVAWSRPALVNESRFAISDGNHIFLVEEYNLPPQGELSGTVQYMKSMAEMTLEGEVLGPLAALDDQVFAVVSEKESSKLFQLSGEDLSVKANVELEGQPMFGPVTNGDYVYLGLPGKLMAFDNKGEPAWTLPMNNDHPADVPIRDADVLILATLQGKVIFLDATDGTVKKVTETGRSLASSPVKLGPRLYIRTNNGSIIAVDR